MAIILSTADPGFAEGFAALVAAKRDSDADVDDAVAAILDDVAQRGDAAVVEHTNRFDRVALGAADLRLKPAEIDALADDAPAETVAALRLAAGRIEAFHRRQLPSAIDYVDETGVRLGLVWKPLASVGL